jgi:hypothetical protein
MSEHKLVLSDELREARRMRFLVRKTITQSPYNEEVYLSIGSSNRGLSKAKQLRYKIKKAAKATFKKSLKDPF